MDFLINNFWLTGYFINATVFFGLVTYLALITADIGKDIMRKLRENQSYEVSMWVFIVWLIPYIGVYSLVRFLYQWNRIKADSLLERVDKWSNRDPGVISRIFLKQKDTKPTTEVFVDTAHSSDAI